MEQFNFDNTDGIEQETLTIMNELFEGEIEQVTDGEWHYNLGAVVSDNPDTQMAIDRLERSILKLVDAY